MTNGTSTMMLLLGLVAIVCVTGALRVIAGHAPIAAGISAGFGIAYIGFLLFYLFLPRPGAKGNSFLPGYLPGAVARYAVMIGVFCAVIFWLKMHTIGVLLGTFIGMTISTFVSLNTMRRKTAKPPEA